MKIRRSRPEADFTIIPNSALRDDRLSYCARGVLTELLSRPNGWETNADALSDRARRHRGDVVGEGRRGLRAAQVGPVDCLPSNRRFEALLAGVHA